MITHDQRNANLNHYGYNLIPVTMVIYNNISLYVHMNICMFMRTLKKEQYIPLVPVAAMEISVDFTQGIKIKLSGDLICVFIQKY